MRKLIRKLVAVAMAVSMSTMVMINGVTMAFAESSTGVGLCAHVMKAYNEDWQYVWGGTTPGAVDCSGLIWSYNGVGGIRTDMLGASDEWGYVSNGIPNIHGLGLHQPGHVGVYIGSGMAVDARDENSDIVLQSVYNKSWVEWFKIDGVSYPTNGWVLFNGQSFYYENGEYLVNTTRTLDGVTYTFASSGASNIAPPDSAYAATDYSTATAPQPPSNTEETVSKVETSTPEVSKEEVSKPEPSKIEVPQEEPSQVDNVIPEPVQETSEVESQPVIEESEPEANVEENPTIAVYGDENENVLTIQKRLAYLGYLNADDSTTGYFGNNTYEAVAAFQTNSKLDVTGIVDGNTYNALMSNDAVTGYKTLSVGDYDDGVTAPITRLQARLAELGYYTDEVTGVYGKATECAVKLFQTEAGLRVSGEADSRTQTSLYRESAVRNPNVGSITYGMQSALVTQVQARLIELRYYIGTPSEVFDDETLTAVNAFQVVAGYEPSETLTAEQIELLNSDDAPKSENYNLLAVGYSGDDVADLQYKLTTINYYDGPSTSVYTNDMEDAVKLFQADSGLEITGVVDESTRNAIDTEASRQNSEIGQKAILNTAKISDEALASVAEAKVQAVQMSTYTTNSSSAIKTLITTAIILCAGIFMTAVFMVEIKKYNARTRQKTQHIRKA
ncbi:MAG: peptidoglycan-binding protein [Acutalibacteraceae bacterium]